MMRATRAVIVGLTACVLGPSAIAQAPQAPASVKVTLLGTGSPTVSAERLGPCTLVEAGSERLLFDAGRGCAIRLAQARVPWSEMTNVFLTHLHADHTFALPDLFLTGWILGRSDSLQVRGPSGTKEMLASMIHALDVDIASRLRSGMRARQPPTYVATEIEPGIVYERGGMRVTAFEVDHSVKPAFGYRVDVNGRSVVLSGDTRYSETLIRNAHGVDVLIHEVVFGPPGMTTEQRLITDAHTLPDKAAQVFTATKPKLAIYSHLILFGVSDDDVMAATSKLYSGRVEMGTDLTVIEVGDTISVRRSK
jgi:ribonuclease Z